jgi:hypothetical protein
LGGTGSTVPDGMKSHSEVATLSIPEKVSGPYVGIRPKDHAIRFRHGFAKRGAFVRALEIQQTDLVALFKIVLQGGLPIGRGLAVDTLQAHV